MEEVENLIKKYDVLLGLYAELETVSGEIFHALETGSPLDGMAAKIEEKRTLVEQIGKESRLIASVKKTIAEKSSLSDSERARVRDAEENLTKIVNHVVEQGEKIFDLMTKQGIRVSRQ